jgi:hypothetical protein
VQPLGCSGEGELLCNGHEVAEMPQLNIHAATILIMARPVFHSGPVSAYVGFTGYY